MSKDARLTAERLAVALQCEVDALRAKLAKAQQRIDALEHHEWLIEARTRSGITDCSTPLFIRVENIVEQRDKAYAELAALKARLT